MTVSWDPRFFERSAFFGTIAGAAERLAHHASFPSPEEIDAALSEVAGVRFVRQAPRSRRARRTPRDPAAMYDARIALEGQVPTRPGSWHDLLNALVWATFPGAKRALHDRQHRLVTPGAPRRTRELDALALLDEGGVVLAAAEPLDLLAMPEGEEGAIVQKAVAEGRAALAVFGHAIYEGLALGWPPPIASLLVVTCPACSGPSELDSRVAEAALALTDPHDLSRLPLSIPSP